jgi:AcrR family transcriptional regulator
MANPTHYDGDLRGALVHAGLDLLREEGLPGLTLRAVARRAGVSHAAPAHHVGDMAGLVAAIALHGQGLLATRMADAAGDTSDPRAILVAGVRAYLEFAADESELFAVMFRPELWHGHPEVAAAHTEGLAATRAAVEDAQLAGWATTADPDALALAVWSFAHGIASLQALGSWEATTDINVEAVLDLLDPASAHVLEKP